MSDSFESVTPTDFSTYDKSDTAHVGWYYIPVENGVPTWMDPYLNENINIYMISYVVPLFINGTSIGIIGMDINFDYIVDIASEVKGLEGAYAFITNGDGMITYHPELEVGTELESIQDGELSRVNEYLCSQSQSSILSYKYENKAKIMTSDSLENGMVLAYTIKRSAIYENANELAIRICFYAFIGIAIAVILGILIGRNLEKPIRAITQVVKQTAALDFSSTGTGKKLLKRSDEIGIMARAVKEMRGALRDILDTMTKEKEQMSSNMILLDGLMQEMSEISEENSATTEEMATAMEETNDHTVRIAEDIVAVRDYANGIKEISEVGEKNSKETLSRAKSMKDKTSSAVKESYDVFERLKVKAQNAIKEAEVVKKINDLTKQIGEISSQTNLLALNASIEAARAGESGQGFSVVAIEIKSLADQTIRTVEGIDEMIIEVNDSVEKMTESLDEMLAYLSETVVADYRSFEHIGQKYEEDADDYSESMEQAKDNITKLSERINRITDAIESVRVAIEQSSIGVEQIAEKSQVAVECNTKGCGLLDNNKSNIDTLKQLIEKFKLS